MPSPEKPSAAPTSPPSRGHKLAGALREHRGAILIGLIFLALCLYYNVSIPLWESDNEWPHYNYVRYLLDHKALPAPDSAADFAVSNDACRGGDPILYLESTHQFRQPPLYYLLGAATVFWVDVGQALPIDLNPHRSGDSQTGYNFALHTPAEAFPYTGVSLAVHVLRGLSSLIGLLGLVATYLTGLILFPARRNLALAMMATNAFIPQYVFSSAVINNDILVGVLGSWCIFFCVHLIVRRWSPAVFLLAVLMAGLATITKYNGTMLIPVVLATGLVAMVDTWRTRPERLPRVLLQTGLLAIVAAIPVLIWFGRNKLLFGEFIVRYPAVDAALNWLRQSPGDNQLWDPVEIALSGFSTLWGRFGWDNLMLPAWVLILLLAICLLALSGAILFLLDKREPTRVRLVVLIALLFIVEAWAISLIRAAGSSDIRGRYLLPAFSAVSLVLVVGWHRVFPSRWKDRGLTILWVTLMILAAAVPALLLRPAYTPPRLADSAALQAGEEPVKAVFGDFAELLAYRVEPDTIQVGDKAKITLLWRALQPTSNNYTVGIHLLDGDNKSHGSLGTYPGNGNYPTSLWQPGEVLRDTYEITLSPSAEEQTPSLGRIKVAVFCYSPDGNHQLDVADPEGNVVGDALYLGRFKLAPRDRESPPPVEPIGLFGDALALESYRLEPEEPLAGDEMSLELVWRVLRQPAHDYTLFAHLIDEAGQMASGTDQPLTQGYYPSGLWGAGEQVVHRHRLQMPLPAKGGPFNLVVGLYDPQTGLRLPVRDAGGLDQPQGQIELAAFSLPQNYLFLPYASGGSPASTP